MSDMFATSKVKDARCPMDVAIPYFTRALKCIIYRTILFPRRIFNSDSSNMPLLTCSYNQIQTNVFIHRHSSVGYLLRSSFLPCRRQCWPTNVAGDSYDVTDRKRHPHRLISASDGQLKPRQQRSGSLITLQFA